MEQDMIHPCESCIEHNHYAQKKAEEMTELLAGVTELLYSAVLCAEPTPFQFGVAVEMANPKPGDLVLEVSDPSRPAIERLGKLVAARSDDYVVMVNGETVHWSNAQFIAVKTRQYLRGGGD